MPFLSDAAGQTFIEVSLLNNLSVLSIDEKNKITTGIVTEFNKKIHGMYPQGNVVSESSHYIFGAGMKYDSISNEKRNRKGEFRKRGSRGRYYTHEHQILTPLRRSLHMKALSLQPILFDNLEAIPIIPNQFRCNYPA